MCLIGDGGDGSVGIIVLLSLLFHVPAVAAATTTLYYSAILHLLDKLQWIDICGRFTVQWLEQQKKENTKTTIAKSERGEEIEGVQWKRVFKIQ